MTEVADSPTDVRYQRLATRENGEFLRVWHARWDTEEE